MSPLCKVISAVLPGTILAPIPTNPFLSTVNFVFPPFEAVIKSPKPLLLTDKTTVSVFPDIVAIGVGEVLVKLSPTKSLPAIVAYGKVLKEDDPKNPNWAD